MGISPFNNFIFLTTITLAYGFLYSRMDPKDFGFKSPIDPYYFAFTTMSTVGYGDIGPKTDRAKMLVMSQQGVLIGELVTILGSLVSNNRR